MFESLVTLCIVMLRAVCTPGTTCQSDQSVPRRSRLSQSPWLREAFHHSQPQQGVPKGCPLGAHQAACSCCAGGWPWLTWWSCAIPMQVQRCAVITQARSTKENRSSAGRPQGLSIKQESEYITKLSAAVHTNTGHGTLLLCCTF